MKEKAQNTIRSIIEGRQPATAREKTYAGLLSAVAAPYAMVTKLRNMAYDAGALSIRRLPVPVICIGNLTVGGTGKTPVTAAVAQLLIQHGHRPAIISRGYGARARKPDAVEIVCRGEGPCVTSDISGDEPYLLAQLLPQAPIVVCADRCAAGMKAIEEFNPTIIIMDDGFQHRRLHRDIDFVLLDASRAPERMQIFPRGPLREGFSALARATLIGLTRADRSPFLAQWEAIGRRHAPGKPILPVHFEPAGIVIPGQEPVVHALEWISGKKALAFCGIGHPKPFFQSLEDAGAEIAGTKIYKDHYTYTVEDLESLAAQAKDAGAEILITTEKDAARIRAATAANIPLAALRIRAAFDCEPLLRLVK